jgi:hypothetical protein
MTEKIIQSIKSFVSLKIEEEQAFLNILEVKKLKKRIFTKRRTDLQQNNFY